MNDHNIMEGEWVVLKGARWHSAKPKDAHSQRKETEGTPNLAIYGGHCKGD
jgi:hypothetical protein